MNGVKTTVRLGFVLTILLFLRQAAMGDPPAGDSYLPQGWTAEDRDWFYYTTQGSRLIPYRWFMALEQPENEQLFRDDGHIASLQFLPGEVLPRNPEKLPIGFVKDEDAVDQVFDLKIAQYSYGVSQAERATDLGKESKKDGGSVRDALALLRPKKVEPAEFPDQRAWLGLTCAACHTGKIETKRGSILIDGAPTLADFTTFMESLDGALKNTLKDPKKFKRFAGRVLGDAAPPAEVAKLSAAVTAFESALAGLNLRSKPDHPFGFGRLDAFGILLNEIVGTSMQLPENWRVPNAPVSYPFLWLTPDLDWVQWNGSAHAPLARNVGEVLGVFADLKLTDLNKISTSTQIRKLYELEERIKKLQPPKWPEAELGAIDTRKAAAGATLYRKFGCADCHPLPPYPLTTEPAGFRPLVAIKMVGIAQVGTDRDAAFSFATRKGKTGILKPLLGDSDEEPIAKLLNTAVTVVLESEFRRLGVSAEEKVRLLDRRGPKAPTPEHLLSYKARPLAGVWATAPFLHNGSVPSLFELLLPANQRSQKFRVGSWQFDAVKVGYRTDQGDFELDTSLPGNRNTGHEYGSTATDEERAELLEYLKSL